MSTNAKKTNDKTKTTEEIVKQTMAEGGTLEDAQEEVYQNRNQNIYIQLFFGDQSKPQIKQQGKPTPPY
jgi:hypothetical protein